MKRYNFIIVAGENTERDEDSTGQKGLREKPSHLLVVWGLDPEISRLGGVTSSPWATFQ